MRAVEREERGEEAVGDEGPADRFVLAVTAAEASWLWQLIMCSTRCRFSRGRKPKSIRFSVLRDVHATHAHFRVNSAPFSDKGGFRATRKQPGYAPDKVYDTNTTLEELSMEKLASFPGRFCGGEEKRPGHHCWRMRVVPIKTWEFVHVCTLSAYTLVISRNISVHDYEWLSVLLQLRER